jgi:general secretion pathway protein G
MIARKQPLMERRQRRGFTLIEVLVVVMIIVILAGGGTVLYLKYLEEAKANASYTRLKNVEKACEAYAISHSGNPPSLDVLLAQNGGTLEQDALYDAWGQPIGYSPDGGQYHGGNGKPDLWVQGHAYPDGSPIYNK